MKYLVCQFEKSNFENNAKEKTLKRTLTSNCYNFGNDLNFEIVKRLKYFKSIKNLSSEKISIFFKNSRRCNPIKVFNESIHTQNKHFFKYEITLENKRKLKRENGETFPY